MKCKKFTNEPINFLVQKLKKIKVISIFLNIILFLVPYFPIYTRISSDYFFGLFYPDFSSKQFVDWFYLFNINVPFYAPRMRSCAVVSSRKKPDCNEAKIKQ